MACITIDGENRSPEGKNILECALDARILHFLICAIAKDLNPLGSYRMCIIAGGWPFRARTFLYAESEDGLVIIPRSDEIRKLQILP